MHTDLFVHTASKVDVLQRSGSVYRLLPAAFQNQWQAEMQRDCMQLCMHPSDTHVSGCMHTGAYALNAEDHMCFTHYIVFQKFDFYRLLATSCLHHLWHLIPEIHPFFYCMIKCNHVHESQTVLKLCRHFTIWLYNPLQQLPNSYKIK